MNPERWQRIKDAFSAALDVPTEQRVAWLSSALPEDSALAREVKELLAAHDRVTDFYDRGALAAVPEARRQLEGVVEGTRLGPYRVLSELGRGGMGAVYLAVREEPGFTQKVAIKLIKRGMDTDEVVRRFAAERQILATLAHPNIARLFDSGSAPDGRPYFVMEHVEGRPITAYAEERKLSIEDRLRLFLRVCRAVQHAHQSLVVHRDLKPANILVDAEGEPRLLDFGIAKLLDPGAFGGAPLTGLTPGPMTPDYASPEQRAGGPVTTATDVYGLGLLLYELLVGHSPRALQEKLGEGWVAQPPSQTFAALTMARGIEKKLLVRRLAGDLDAIAGKALQRAPERRYGTAAALAEDIERHLAQRPVTARRSTLVYRLGRALLSHRFAAILILAVSLLAAGSTAGLFVVGQERDRADAQRQRAEALVDFLQSLIQKANPKQSRGKDLTVRQVLDAGAEDLLGRDSRYQAETWAALLETMGTIYRDLGLYDQAEKNLQRALLLRESLPASSAATDLALAENLTALGSVSLERGAFAESRGFFQRALALKEHRIDPFALALVDDLNGLGTAFLNEGDLERASRHFDRACLISRLAGEDGFKNLADCYNNLGALAARKEKLARASILFSAALRYYQSTYGDEHPETIQVRANLGYCLLGKADYAGAEAQYQKIVDVRRRLFEPNHPDLARSLQQLAAAQLRGRRLAEAEATLHELVELRRKYRFPRDQSEAETWHLMGALAFESKNLKAADAAYTRSYEIYRALHGEYRANLSYILTARARVLLLRGDPVGALGLARRSRELAQATDILSGDPLALAEDVIGACDLALGQPSRARPHLERSHELLLGIYGPDHPYTRKAENALRRLDASAD